MKAKKLVFGVILMLSWNVAVLASEYYRLGQDYRSLAMGNTGIAGSLGTYRFILQSSRISQYSGLVGECSCSGYCQ